MHGVHYYKIKYLITGPIVNRINNYNSLSWSIVSSSGWMVPIKKGSLIVKLPFSSNLLVDKKCYGGISKKCSIIEKDKNSIKFIFGPIKLKGTFMVQLTFPMTAINISNHTSRNKIPLPDRGVLFIFSLFACLVYVGVVWIFFGKKFIYADTIISRYTIPENFDFFELSLLLYGRIHKKALSAELINLAVKGYLTIERNTQKLKKIKKINRFFFFTIFLLGISNYFIKMEEIRIALLALYVILIPFILLLWYFFVKRIKEKSYKIIRTGKKISEDISAVEKILLRELFISGNNVSLDILKTQKSMPFKVNRIRRKSFNKLYADGYLKFTELKWSIISIIIVIIPSLFIFLMIGDGGAMSIYYLGEGIVVWFILKFIISSNTKKADVIVKHLKGVKMYLKIAEKDRLEFHSKFKRNNKIFEQLLPVVIFLGMEKRWTKQFSEIVSELNLADWVTDDIRVIDFNYFSDFTSLLGGATDTSFKGGNNSGGNDDGESW